MTPFLVKCEKIPRQQKYKVIFDYHPEVVERIKQNKIEYRKFYKIGSSGYWTLHTRALFNLIKSYKKSKKIHFDFGSDEERNNFIEQIQKISIEDAEIKRVAKELEEKKKHWIELKDDLDKNYKKYWDDVHKNLKDGIKLYPYQVAATIFTNEVKNVLLALDMGLGKTLSSIAYVEMNDYQKVFVLTPNSLKFNYFNEVEKFTDSKAHIITPKGSSYKNKYTIEESKYVIVNYEFFNPSDKKIFETKFKKLGIDKIDALIADECQALKNSASNTYKNFKRTFKKSLFRNGKESKVFLSGTPAPNRAYELYNVLNQISSIDFATKTYFYEYYCGMTYDRYGFGWETNINNQKFEELFHKIAPYVYRKRKDEVLADLPDKIYQNIMLEMNDKERKIHDMIESDDMDDLNLAKISNPLTTMLKTRQYLSSIKFNYVKDIIMTILESGEKVVIVDMFKEPLYDIYEQYKDIAVLHTGDQSVEERAKYVAKFQDPKSNVKIFLASIQTANYGLTLTQASKMFILTLPYSVGEYDQVADRLHRIGQKDTVNIYPVLFNDTLDEYVFDVIESKRKEIVKAIDNEDYSSDISQSVVGDLIRKLKNKYN